MLALSLFISLPRFARADAASCAQAHASAQREAKAGRLKAAAEQFLSCSTMEDCPDEIRSECADFYRDTERNLPTVIFAALDERGADLIHLRVYSDDEVAAEGLDGRAIPVDPGQHHFKFELPSGQVLVSDALIHEGEKNRIISVRVPPPKPETETPPLLPGGNRRPLPPGFWVASSVSVVALASWSVFAVLGRGAQSTLGECSPHCPASQRANFDAMRRDYLVADISLGAALASAGVATWLFMRAEPATTPDRHGPVKPTLRVTVTPLVSTRGAGLLLDTRAF